MPRTARLNFTVPQDVVEMLRQQVSNRKRSSFVADAIREKLVRLESEQLKKDLIEGYTIRREEDSNINSAFEHATLEKWPD